MSDSLNIELLDLETKTIPIKSIFIDPNNPRLMSISGDGVPENRITEKSIQNETFKRTKDIGIKDITEKIKKVGFLTVDRIVVRPLSKGKYVVIEGNRRITSVNYLLEEHSKGRLSLPENIYNSMQNIECLVYNGDDKNISWFLQGLRHIHGVKSWGPLEQARFLVEMQENRGLTPTELSSMTGIGRSTAAKYIRSYHAWLQARENDEYGDYVETQHFSLFNEAVFVKSGLKDWLSWDDVNRKFTTEENLEKVLKWYLPHKDENDNKIEPRISRAIDIRDILSPMILDENKSTLQKFENEIIDIDQARNEIFSKESDRESKLDSVDLSKQLDNLQSFILTLNTLPTPLIIKDEKTGGIVRL